MQKIYSILLIFILTQSLMASAATDYDKSAESIKNLLGELVAADTTNPPGNEAVAVTILAARLKKAGIPYEVSEFEPGRQNLVARLKGNGKKRPLLILSHLDVVPSEGQNWSSPSHKMTEKDGYLVGRGVNDDLGYGAISLELLILLKESEAKLDRDIIVAWTGDEERGGRGIQYLLKNHPSLILAEYALYEGGSVILNENGNGKPKLIELEVAQKVYQDFHVVAKGLTGHSSVPLKENAIYKLAHALERFGRHQEPVRLIPVTRAYFEARAKIEEPKLAAAMVALAKSKGIPPAWAVKMVEATPALAATLRTTCVATLLSGGTAPNALPSEAKANINCRIMPDETVEQVHARIKKVMGSEVQVSPDEDFGHTSPASPVSGPVYEALQKLDFKPLKGIPLIPKMATGATDSVYLRVAGIPSYGITPIFITEDDKKRAHGIDERIPTASLRTGIEFFHKLVLKIAASE